MKLLLVLVVSLYGLHAQAQVRKCVDAAGKTVYSDVVCADTRARETAVNTRPNSLDTSGLVEQANRASAAGDLERMTANPPRECRFAHYTYADAKGKALSENAKAECIANLIAKRQGGPTSTNAYAMWKDHYGQKSTERRALGAQIAANENARQNRAAIEDGNRKILDKLDQPLKCTKDPLSLTPSMTCK